MFEEKSNPSLVHISFIYFSQSMVKNVPYFHLRLVITGEVVMTKVWRGLLLDVGHKKLLGKIFMC